MAIAGRTDAEYKLDIREKLQAQSKEYSRQHRHERSECHKIWYEQNRDRAPSERKQRFTCECGKTYTAQHKARHETSTYHKNNLKADNQKKLF